jgi:hypothetical protein
MRDEDDFRQSLDRRRTVACLRACDGICTDHLERYGRRAFVRSLALIPVGQEAVIHDILGPPLRPDEKVVGFVTCPHCKHTRPVTEADKLAQAVPNSRKSP